MKERRWCSGGGCVWSNTKWKSCGRMPIQVLQSQWRSITPLGKFTNVEEMWEGHTLITWKNLPKTNLFLQQSLKTQGTIPLVKSAKCKCARHKPGCRCLSDSYLKGARISHFSCLQQCMEPLEYARCIGALSQYHCRDVHKWENGICGFHENIACNCKKCNEGERKCEGTPYHTKSPLKCDFHWLAYRIEGERRALGLVHTYPFSFEKETFFLHLKKSHVHTRAFSNHFPVHT